MKEKVCSVLTSLLAALAVLTGAIAVPLLVRPFYSLHVDALHLEKLGLPREQILEAYDQVMDYCMGWRADFAAGVVPFSQSGADHFADVRVLFILNMAVLAVSLLGLGVLWVWRRRAGFSCHRFGGRSPGFWAACGLGTAGIVVGILAATDFDRAFTVFHHLFFPGKDNWLFNPYTDPIILLLPEVFFRNCAILILVCALVMCALLLWTGRKK